MVDERTVSKYFFSEENFVFLNQLVQRTIYKRFRVRVRRDVNTRMLEIMKSTYDCRPVLRSTDNENDYIVMLNKKVLSETLAYAAQSAMRDLDAAQQRSLNENRQRQDTSSTTEQFDTDLAPRPAVRTMAEENPKALDSTYEQLLRQRATQDSHSPSLDPRSQTSYQQQGNQLKAPGLREEYIIPKPQNVASGIPSESLEKDNDTMKRFELEEQRRRAEAAQEEQIQSQTQPNGALTTVSDIGSRTLSVADRNKLKAISMLPPIPEKDEDVQSSKGSDSGIHAVETANPSELQLTSANNEDAYVNVQLDPAYAEYYKEPARPATTTSQTPTIEIIEENDIDKTEFERRFAETLKAREDFLTQSVKQPARNSETLQLDTPSALTASAAAVIPTPVQNRNSDSSAGDTRNGMIPVTVDHTKAIQEQVGHMANQMRNLVSTVDKLVTGMSEVINASTKKVSVEEPQRQIALLASTWRDSKRFPTVSSFEVVCTKPGVIEKVYIPRFDSGLPLVRLTIGDVEVMCEASPSTRDRFMLTTKVEVKSGTSTVNLEDLFGEQLYCKCDVADIVSIKANNLRLIFEVSDYHDLHAGEKILFTGNRSQNKDLEHFLNRKSGHKIYTLDGKRFEIDSGGFLDDVTLTHFGQIIQTKKQVYLVYSYS